MISTEVLLSVAMSAVSLHPTESMVTEEVDLIEISHVYDEHGRKFVSQLLFYEWVSYTGGVGRFEIIAWRLLGHTRNCLRPQWRADIGRYEVIWFDRRGGNRMRRVLSRQCSERWDQHDPEIESRPIHPGKRTGLTPSVYQKKKDGWEWFKLDPKLWIGV